MLHKLTALAAARLALPTAHAQDDDEETRNPRAGSGADFSTAPRVDVH